MSFRLTNICVYKETSTCRFDLSEDSSIIQAMLGWVYNKKFSEDEVDTDKSPEFLQLLINVCLAADYYGVPGLQSYAEARFRDAAKEWNKMDEALPDVVRLIYANYDVPIIQTIKKEILDLTLEHLKVLESSHIYQTLFSDVGGFTRDLLFMSQAEKLLESRKTSKQYCSSCGETMMINFESSGYYHCAFCGTYSYFYAPSH